MIAGDRWRIVYHFIFRRLGKFQITGFESLFGRCDVCDYS